MVRPGTSSWLRQGGRKRMTGDAGGWRHRCHLDQRADHGGPEVGRRGGERRAAVALLGRRHHARQGKLGIWVQRQIELVDGFHYNGCSPHALQRDFHHLLDVVCRDARAFLGRTKGRGIQFDH